MQANRLERCSRASHADLSAPTSVASGPAATKRSRADAPSLLRTVSDGIALGVDVRRKDVVDLVAPRFRVLREGPQQRPHLPRPHTAVASVATPAEQKSACQAVSRLRTVPGVANLRALHQQHAEGRLQASQARHQGAYRPSSPPPYHPYGGSADNPLFPLALLDVSPPASPLPHYTPVAQSHVYECAGMPYYATGIDPDDFLNEPVMVVLGHSADVTETGGDGDGRTSP